MSKKSSHVIGCSAAAGVNQRSRDFRLVVADQEPAGALEGVQKQTLTKLCGAIAVAEALKLRQHELNVAPVRVERVIGLKLRGCGNLRHERGDGKGVRDTCGRAEPKCKCEVASKATSKGMVRVERRRLEQSRLEHSLEDTLASPGPASICCW